MNAAELSQRMADQAVLIAEHLLPEGKKQSGEWKAGSISGEAGNSLSVRLTGVKRGVWKDFAADIGGDLLDLWVQCRGVSLAEAMREAKDFLGIREDMPARERKTFRRPTKPPCKRAEGVVAEWLRGRGITDETMRAFSIAEQVRDGKVYAVFPYLRDDELVNVKYRSPTDKRDMRQESGAEPCLFGWQLIDPKAREIAIAEGEIDAMTLHQAGIPALSVNAGAGNHQWIESDWERLDRFSTIWLCFDDDEAGRKGVAEVVERLGVDRCRLVKFGAKDANEFLQQGATPEQFRAAISVAKPLDPPELVSMAVAVTASKALFYPAEDAPRDPVLMFGRKVHDWFEFRPSEVTIWTGINGHGKSLMLSQVLLNLLHQGERACVFSGEMMANRQGKRIVKQATGLDRPTPEYIDAVADWIDDRMWLINILGSATMDRLVQVFAYAARRYGISHFVVDSLMMTDVPEDGPGSLSAQKAAMHKLTNFAKQARVHVHLVAHPRKVRDESVRPGKMDVAGSGQLTNAADNVFSVWSSRKDDGEPDDGEADALLELHKQRNGDMQHKKVWLFYNPASMQYCSNSDRRSVTFVPYSRDLATHSNEELEP